MKLAQTLKLLSSIVLEPYIAETTKARRCFENWLRLVALINSAGKYLCYEILHEKEMLTDGAQLYFELEKYKKKMHYQIHKEIFCPPNKIIEEEKFDLKIYAAVIHMMFGAKYKELIHDVRDMRNKIFHMKNKSIYTADFEQLWSDASVMLCNYGYDVKLVGVFRTCDLSSSEMHKGIL